MGTTERRRRQKQETREGILNAARLIARKEGWEAVTIRRVAELIEYSPPIIYEYFENKNALLEDLQGLGFAQLAAEMRQASAGEPDMQAKLLRMGDAYWLFAHEQPELYQLMHGGVSTRVPLDTTLLGATAVANVVQEGLEAWAAARGVTLHDPEGALEIAWCMLHGLISVGLLGRLGGGEERARQLARRGLEDLLAAWAAQ